MPNEILRKFAENLKNSREAKDITLQQIAHRTKIDLKFLEAIEEARFDVLPNLYIRSFMKEYAAVIDLNPQDTIAKFDAAQIGKKEEHPVKETVEKEEESTQPKVFEVQQQNSPVSEPNKEENQRQINSKYLIVAVIGSAIIILAYFLFFNSSSSDIIIQNSQEESKKSNVPAFEMEEPKNDVPNTQNVEQQNDSLQLAVNTTQRVWVKVISDKNVKYEGMVDANMHLTYNAFAKFRVVLGNAGFVQLTLNGKPINNIGEKGEVRNITITADSVNAYTLLIPSKNENQPQQEN